MLPEKYIAASTASSFPFLRIQTVDFSGDFEDPPTVAQLRARTEAYITANNIGHPSVSVDVNFVALWQTEEYADIAPLERVQLGDTVTVYFEKLEISEQARVVAYTYDVLRERYEQISIGDLKSSFAKTFVDQGHLIEETKDSIAWEVTKGTSWLTKGNGYVVARKNTDGSWKELLFLDTPSIDTAQHVLRINEMGIGFSSTGYNGSYSQSWTLDGTLTLGGVNNSYGSLELKDRNARTTAEFDNEGIWLDEYNSGGSRTSSAYVYGDGISVSASGNSAGADITSGQIIVSDDDGTSCTITGSEVSVNEVAAQQYWARGREGFSGSYTFADGTKFWIYGGITAGIDEGSGLATVEQLEEIWEAIDEMGGGGSGGGGVSHTITINPTKEVDLEFTNGLLTDYDQSPW